MEEGRSGAVAVRGKPELELLEMVASRSVTAVTDGAGQNRGCHRPGETAFMILLSLGVAGVEIVTGRVSLAYYF